uniref:Uncharacterized protein n=1 Tax=Kalanchoe fedtschenkoi TaxID=63787 RepID=A0A7N0VCH4_KALFE
MSRHRRQSSLVLPLDLSEDWTGPDPAAGFGCAVGDSNAGKGSVSSKPGNASRGLVDPGKDGAERKPPVAEKGRKNPPCK